MSNIQYTPTSVYLLLLLKTQQNVLLLQFNLEVPLYVDSLHFLNSFKHLFSVVSNSLHQTVEAHQLYDETKRQAG